MKRENEFVRLSREFGFRPTYLQPIIARRNLGYNNTEIARSTGISRVTINSYIDKIKQNENQEKLGKLILLGLTLYFGAKILDEIIGNKNNRR